MNVSILTLAMNMLPFESYYPGPYTLPYTFEIDAAIKSSSVLRLLYYLKVKFCSLLDPAFVKEHFGGIYIYLFGDYRQLPLVLDTPVYGLFANYLQVSGMFWSQY